MTQKQGTGGGQASRHGETVLEHIQPPAHHRAPPDTSAAAAESMKPFVPSLRRELLEWLGERGVRGATDAEIAAAFPERTENTLRPLRVALVKARLAIDSGTRRRTPTGRKAAVWVRSCFPDRKGGAA